MQGIIFYFQLFTRIPINIQIADPATVYRKDIHCFWVFASMYSMMVMIIYRCLLLVFDHSIAWLLILLTEVLLTGAFHHDAFADTCDGVFSSRKKTEILKIMKDPRIGTNGTIALIFYYLLMYALGSEVLNQAPIVESCSLVFCTMLIARFGLQLNFWSFKYSGHTQGLGTILVGMSRKKLCISLLAMCVITVYLLSWRGLLAIVVVALGMIIYRRKIYTMLDGMNGDTVGASALLSQLLFLMTILLSQRMM